MPYCQWSSINCLHGVLEIKKRKIATYKFENTQYDQQFQ